MKALNIFGDVIKQGPSYICARALFSNQVCGCG